MAPAHVQACTDDKGSLLAAFSAQATPSGCCSAAKLEQALPHGLPALPRGDGNGTVSREDFLRWLFGEGQDRRELFGKALVARSAALLATAQASERPTRESAWPQGSSAVVLSEGQKGERLWNYCLFALGSSKPAPALAGEHFKRVVEAGGDANAVAFPHKALREGKVLAPLTPICDLVKRDANAVTFPLLEGNAGDDTWAEGAEKEAGEKWLAGLAHSAEELRDTLHSDPQVFDMTLMPWPMKEWAVIKADRCLQGQLQVLKQRRTKLCMKLWRFERKQAKTDPGFFEEARYLRGKMHQDLKALDMVLEPWPVKECGVIAEDRCTDEQLRLIERRERCPPPQRLIELRRAKVVSPRFFEEVMPTLEREASLAEMRARWARDRATAARLHDEAAELGAGAVAWPADRRWPKPPAAWTRHAAWFKMWRKTQMDQLAQLVQARVSEAPKLKRQCSESSWEALSECSEASWQAISEQSWLEVEEPVKELSPAEQATALKELALKMQAAEEAIDCISLSSIQELKALAKPPCEVVPICCTAGILLGLGSYVKDWKGCCKMLGNPQGLIANIKGFDAKNIPAARFHKVQTITQEPFFNFENMAKKSFAAAHIAKWVCSIIEYHSLYRQVAALRGPVATEPTLPPVPKAPLAVAQAPTLEDIISQALSVADATSQMEAAKGALQCISKKDLTEVKAFKRPPLGVVLTMEAVCITLGKKPARVPDPVNPRKRVNDYWATAKEMMGSPDFLQNLLSFDIDNIQRKVIADLARYIIREDFTFEVVKKASCASAGLCAWVRAVFSYHIAKAALAKASRVAEEPAQGGAQAVDVNTTAPTMGGAPSDGVAAHVDATSGVQGPISKADVVELKSLAKPPDAVKFTMEAVCIMFGLEPDWPTAKALLLDPSFLKKLLEFDKDNIPSEVITKIAPYIVHERFTPEVVKRSSFASMGLCKWVRDMYDYHMARNFGASEKQAPGSPCASTAPPSPLASPLCLSPISAMPSPGPSVPATPQRSASAPCEASTARFKGVNRKDLVEVKSMGAPPVGVMLACHCVMVLRPLGTEDPDSGWKGSKAMLGDVRLLRAMQEYRREDASEEQLNRVREVLTSHEVLAGDKLKMVSKAAYGILEWVRAVLMDTPQITVKSMQRPCPRPMTKQETKWAWVTHTMSASNGMANHLRPWRPTKT